MRRETRRPPEIRLLRGLIAFKQRFGDLPPGVVALAGSGGASKAIAFALAALGATSLRLFDIDAQKAHALASLQFYLNAPERHFVPAIGNETIRHKALFCVRTVGCSTPRGGLNAVDHQEVPMDKASLTSVFLTRGASLLKLTLLGAAAGVAMATVSFAQSYDPDEGSGNIVGPGIAYMVQPDGSTNRVGGRTGRVNGAGHAMAMTHGTEVKPGAVLYRSGGKLYLLHNQMIDGKMVEEHARGWTQ